MEPYARKHWSGSEDLRVVLRDIAETAHSLLGHKLYNRLKTLLRRRGVEVPEAPEGLGEDDDPYGSL